jgi:hypothetical protein
MAVEAMVAEPGFAALSADDVRERLDQVRSQNTTPSYLSAQRPSPAARPADPVAGIQALLRGLASAAEIEDAARLIEAHHPDLATMLRVYGNGRTADARAHYALPSWRGRPEGASPAARSPGPTVVPFRRCPRWRATARRDRTRCP